jgi:hypothetical protein
MVDANAVPRTLPSVFDVLGRSLGDGWTLLRANPIPTFVIVAVALIGALVELVLPIEAGQRPLGERLANWQALSSFVFFFAVATGARTIKPEYQMTFGEFFAFVGWSLLSTIVSVVGFFLFVVPGFWLTGKLWPSAYARVLGSRDPMTDSWNATTGVYWPTLGLSLLFSALSFGITFACAFVTGLLTMVFPVLGIVAMLAGTVIGCWFLYAFALGYLRWTDALLPSRRMTV